MSGLTRDWKLAMTPDINVWGMIPYKSLAMIPDIYVWGMSHIYT